MVLVVQLLVPPTDSSSSASSWAPWADTNTGNNSNTGNSNSNNSLLVGKNFMVVNTVNCISSITVCCLLVD